MPNLLAELEALEREGNELLADLQPAEFGARTITIPRGTAERITALLRRLATLRAGVVGEVTDAMVERALWQYHNTALSGSEGSIDAIRRKKMRAALSAALGRTDTGEG